MSQTAEQLTEQPQRRRGPRKQPHLLTGSEEMILRRMMRIDRGEGCHATVERIGKSIDDLHVSFSVSQTRRYLRRLREMGHIHFAGQTASGRNIYLFNEREYRLEQVPVCASRPIEHLQTLPSGASWAKEKARAILNMTDREGPAARVALIDGFPVNKQLLKSYSEATIRRAVAALKKAYPDPARMRNRTALLRYFITLEMQEEKKRREQALAEQVRQAAHRGAAGAPGAVAPSELGSQLLALMREGRHAEAKELAESMERAPAATINTASALTAPSPSSPPSTLCASSTSSAPSALTVAAMLDRFVKVKTPGAEETPTSYYRKKAEQLRRLLGPIRICELTPAELSLYQRKRRSERVQEATVKAELKVLRQALGAAAAAQLVPLSVLEAVVPSAPRAGPRSSRLSGDAP